MSETGPVTGNEINTLSKRCSELIMWQARIAMMPHASQDKYKKELLEIAHKIHEACNGNRDFQALKTGDIGYDSQERFRTMGESLRKLSERDPGLSDFYAVSRALAEGHEPKQGVMPPEYTSYA